MAPDCIVPGRALYTARSCGPGFGQKPAGRPLQQPQGTTLAADLKVQRSRRGQRQVSAINATVGAKVFLAAYKPFAPPSALAALSWKVWSPKRASSGLTLPKLLAQLTDEKRRDAGRRGDSFTCAHYTVKRLAIRCCHLICVTPPSCAYPVSRYTIVRQ